MPAWLTVVVAIVTPLLAFTGSAVGHRLSRRSAQELDVWRRREETMRMLRWAAEQAVEDGPAGMLGVALLRSLWDSELMQPQDRHLVKAAMGAVVRPVVVSARRAYTGSEDGGDQDDGDVDQA